MCALWDLKARLARCAAGHIAWRGPRRGAGLRQRRFHLLLATSKLQEQLARLGRAGIPRVKMKIGTHPGRRLDRVRAAREAIGDEVELFVDANGAYSRKQALRLRRRLRDELGVSWFEEPVSVDDLAGLRLCATRARRDGHRRRRIRLRLLYFRRMLDAGAVDVLQADATRCGGITGFLQVRPLVQRALPGAVGALAPSHARAPLLRPPAVASLEYFHDHVRIEHMLFDGALTP